MRTKPPGEVSSLRRAQRGRKTKIKTYMKLALWAIAGVLSLVAAQAYDGQVNVNNHVGRIGTGGGGPFEVTVIGSPAGPLG